MAVTSMVGGEMVVVGRKELAMFGEHDAKQTLFVWCSHMMISDSSHGNPPDVPQISIFFSQNQVGLCTELQDIIIETQFPLYSVQIPPECQIP